MNLWLIIILIDIYRICSD